MRALVLLAVLLLAACQEAPHAVVAPRIADPALLVPCDEPPIPSAAPTATEAAKDWLASVQIALTCSARFNALAAWVTARP